MKLTIPTTQSEITIRQYIQAQGKTEREQLAIYLNITTEVLDQLPQSVYDEALQFISKAMQEDQQEHHRRFFIGGTEFGFYPNLDEIESGAFAVAENTANDVNLAHEFLNAFYRPVKRSVASFYSVGNYVPRRAETLLNAPLSAYTSTMVFFYNIANDLGSYTPNSTQ